MMHQEYQLVHFLSGLSEEEEDRPTEDASLNVLLLHYQRGQKDSGNVMTGVIECEHDHAYFKQ